MRALAVSSLLLLCACPSPSHVPDAGAPRDGGTPLDAGSSVDGGTARVGVLSVAPNELIFSAVQGTMGGTQTLTVTNGSPDRVAITGASSKGAGAAAFAFKVETFPWALEPGESRSTTVTFEPPAGDAGIYAATWTMHSEAFDGGEAEVGLYALATKAEQGNGEPPLQWVVNVLGYPIDVGGNALVLGTGTGLIGAEVAAQMFVKADAGVVTMTPVARYSPDEDVPFGTCAPDGGAKHVVATLVAGEDQQLLPEIHDGGATSFDPGTAPFGLYVHDATNARDDYTVDALNTGGVVHRVRTYPLKDRSGALVANAYLVGFEEATNGDYQDFVFVLRNVRPEP